MMETLLIEKPTQQRCIMTKRTEKKKASRRQHVSEFRAAQDRSGVEQRQAFEIARLKRQLAEQAEELAIVKKAATYFAKSLK